MNQNRENLMNLCESSILKINTKLYSLCSYVLHYQLHCSSFVLFPSVYTLLFMFYLISVSTHFMVHISFQSTVHFIHFTYISQSISFIFTLFGCIHITWSFNLIVSFTFQPIPSLEINDLRVSLDKFLILDRYYLLEVDLRWILLFLVSLY